MVALGIANNRAWCKALKTAGITDFRWHDLRHTWASWLIQKGAPLYALEEMGAWESLEMVQRCAHLSPSQRQQDARIIDVKLGSGTGRGISAHRRYCNQLI